MSIDKKLKELRNVLGKIDDLRKEVENKFPPKSYIVIFEPPYGATRVYYDYSLAEAQKRASFINGGGVYKYKITIAEIVKETNPK